MMKVFVCVVQYAKTRMTYRRGYIADGDAKCCPAGLHAAHGCEMLH